MLAPSAASPRILEHLNVRRKITSANGSLSHVLEDSSFQSSVPFFSGTVAHDLPTLSQLGKGGLKAFSRPLQARVQEETICFRKQSNSEAFRLRSLCADLRRPFPLDLVEAEVVQLDHHK